MAGPLASRYSLFPIPALVLYSLLLQDSIAFRVRAPSSVHAGEPVPIELVLTNRTERPIRLRLHEPPAFDVTVSREDGTVVWRHPPAHTGPAGLAERELAPADSLRFEVVWDGLVVGGGAIPPGHYSIIGRLPTDTPEPLVTLPVRLQVLAVHAE